MEKKRCRELMKKPLVSIIQSVNEWKIKNYQDAIF